MSNPTFKRLMNITWGYFNNTLRFIFYYPLVLNLLFQFKFKVTNEKPIMKIQEDVFYKTPSNDCFYTENSLVQEAATRGVL